MPTLTIPGVETLHPRTEWEPGPGTPLFGDLRRGYAFHRTPASLWLPGIQYIATHYTGAVNIPDGDPGEILSGVDGIRNLLRNAHWDYLNNRSDGGYRRLSDNRWFPGYPLGYSFAFDWLGGVWEINGFDYQPAATSGWNNRALAFLMLTDRADPGSALMWRSHRAVAREALRRGARIAPERVWSHGWFAERTGTGTPTACCGGALEAQINAGYGDYTQDDTGDDDMITLPTPRRAFDSRQTGGPFGPGESREVIVGMTTEAHINVTVVGLDGTSGFISVNDPAAKTSVINYSGEDRIESNTVPVLTPNGRIAVKNSQGRAHVIVDVFASKP